MFPFMFVEYIRKPAPPYLTILTVLTFHQNTDVSQRILEIAKEGWKRILNAMEVSSLEITQKYQNFYNIIQVSIYMYT